MDPERLSTPSPPPGPDPRDTGRHAAIPPVPERLPYGEAKVDRALRVALEARDGVGRPPDVSGFAGSGLWAYVAGIKAAVDKVVTWTEVADRNAARRNAARRLGWGERLGWEVLRTLIPITLAALLAWAGGFLHR